MIWHWAALRADTITNRVAFKRNGFPRGAFIYRCLTQAYFCMISDGGRVSRYKSAASRCKTAISPRLLVIETRFVGKSWPGASLPCNFNLFFWRSTFRASGLCFVDINPRRPAALRPNFRKLWTCRCLYSKKLISTCIFTVATFDISTLRSQVFYLGSWSPPVPMYLPR